MNHVFRSLNGTCLGSFECYDVGVVYCHSLGINNYTVEYPDESEDNSGVYEIITKENINEQST